MCIFKVITHYLDQVSIWYFILFGFNRRITCYKSFFMGSDYKPKPEKEFTKWKKKNKKKKMTNWGSSLTFHMAIERKESVVGTVGRIVMAIWLNILVEESEQKQNNWRNHNNKLSSLPHLWTKWYLTSDSWWNKQKSYFGSCRMSCLVCSSINYLSSTKYSSHFPLINCSSFRL